jgi:hypothetical protein
MTTRRGKTQDNAAHPLSRGFTECRRTVQRCTIVRTSTVEKRRGSPQEGNREHVLYGRDFSFVTIK